MRKEAVEDVLKALPDNFQLDMLIDQLIFREQVETGLKQIDEGKGIPLDEVKSMISEWQK